MIELGIARPSNRFLVRQRDLRWARALTLALLATTAVVGVLALVGWPRLRSISMHYDLIGLRADVRRLADRERELALRMEVWRDPVRLAERARALGLEPPPAPVEANRAMTPSEVAP